MSNNFEIVSEISNIETFSSGSGIRELQRLIKRYGTGKWRKRKGIADIILPSGIGVKVELHWNEASGIGKKEFKIKRIID